MSITSGPIAKNAATQAFEALIKLMVKAPDSVRIQTTGADRKGLQAIVNGEIFDLRDILNNCQFDLLDFDKVDGDLFMDRYPPLNPEDKSRVIPKAHELSRDEEKKLHLAEVVAIRNYSRYHYKNMNALLYGLEEVSHDWLLRTLRNIAFASSGLAKCKRQYGGEGQLTYRSDACSAAEFQKRKELIEHNGYTRIPGFFSTSINPAQARVDNTPGMVYPKLRILNSTGTYIVDVSRYGKEAGEHNEHEVLLAPGATLQFNSFHENPATGVKTFDCTVVQECVEVDHVDQRFRDTLKRLEAKLIQHGVSTDFITESNQALIGHQDAVQARKDAFLVQFKQRELANKHAAASCGAGAAAASAAGKAEVKVSPRP